MDKQVNISSNTKKQIPVNTRTIGSPEGIYILYIEDYVHTFIKKLLSEKNADNRLLKTDDTCQIEKSMQPDIALYGACIEENGRYRLVVSGAAAIDSKIGKIQHFNDVYFPTCAYIGSAILSWNKDNHLRLELAFNNMKVVLDDFYIYYDQNEEMQNYLIEWNSNRENGRNAEGSDRIQSKLPEEHARTRDNTADAARLGRIAQAYNREEAKVSFMWNVMNFLCFGFMVCVMAYGIVSINNYNKMQNMQESIDYCMAYVMENTSSSSTGTDTAQAVATMQQSTQPQSEAEVQQEPQSATEPETVEMTQAASEESVTEEISADTESIVQPDAQPVQADAVPQYYVVRKGDTLRTICFAFYGDYSHVDEICKWNNIEDPDNILYGQKLLLP